MTLFSPADAIGSVCTLALLLEVSATPKPGLVDRLGNGAHNDMDFSTFLSSAAAIAPYFSACAKAGTELPALDGTALARIRPLWEVLPVLMPFVPALGLLLSPVLLDLSVLFPALGPLSRWMPITLYLRACGGAWEDGLVLAAGGAVLLALLAAEDRRHTDRSPSMER